MEPGLSAQRQPERGSGPVACGAVVRGLGICLPVSGPEGGAGLPLAHLAEVAMAAEEAGARSLWLAEGPPDGPGPDAVTVAGALARMTRSCTIGVLADLRTGRAPSLLAKEVTAIDVLSGGRAALAIAWGEPGVPLGAAAPAPGAGAHPVPAPTGSLDVVDVPAGAAPMGTAAIARGLVDRARWIEEAGTVCRGMWREPAFGFSGRHLAVTEAVNRPGPRQQQGPPLLLAMPGRRRGAAVAGRLGAGLLVGGDAVQVARTVAEVTGAGLPVPLVAWRRWWPSETAGEVVADVQSVWHLVEGVVVGLSAADGRIATEAATADVVADVTALAAAVRGDGAVPLPPP